MRKRQLFNGPETGFPAGKKRHFRAVFPFLSHAGILA
jgi:hypothetical protein